jgi:hypothetical protein
VDGSGWEEVYTILEKDGHTVSVVQNPTISLANEVTVTKRVLATHRGAVILVGHSHGGGHHRSQMKHWEMIVDNLTKAD